jgi:hypothetical protein
MLKAILDAAAWGELPDYHQSLYTETADGKYRLNVEGLVPEAELTGLKNKKTELLDEVKALKAQVAKFKDIDPEKAKEALAKLKELDEKKLFDEGKIDEIVEGRVQTMRSDFESQIKALKENNQALKEELAAKDGRLKEVVIDQAITTAYDEMGVKIKPGALQDVLSRARGVWSLDEEGNPVAMDGDKKLFGKDGENPLTVAEWAGGLMANAKHLFEESSGGGSPNNRGKGSGPDLSKLSPVERLKAVRRQATG